MKHIKPKLVIDWIPTPAEQKMKQSKSKNPVWQLVITLLVIYGSVLFGIGYYFLIIKK